MKFSEQASLILESKTDDLGPDDIKDINGRVTFVVYKDNDFVDEWYLTQSEVKKELKGYKWDGKVWVDKKDKNKYASITKSLA